MAPGDERTYIGERLSCLQHCALHRRTIQLTCPSCRHVRRLDAVALWWTFERQGWNGELPGAYRRLYCEACLVTVTEDHAVGRDHPRHADAHQPPYQGESAWWRAVSRYRS